MRGRPEDHPVAIPVEREGEGGDAESDLETRASLLRGTTAGDWITTMELS